MLESSDSVARLESLLRGLGANRSEERQEDAHSETTYVIGALSVHLFADYGSWRANVSLGGGPQFPASFWVAALGGSTSFPEPVVTPEDLERLATALPQLLAEASLVEPSVHAMGDQYRKAMKERLS